MVHWRCGYLWPSSVTNFKDLINHVQLEQSLFSCNIPCCASIQDCRTPAPLRIDRTARTTTQTSRHANTCAQGRLPCLRGRSHWEIMRCAEVAALFILFSSHREIQSLKPVLVLVPYEDKILSRSFSLLSGDTRNRPSLASWHFVNVEIVSASLYYARSTLTCTYTTTLVQFLHTYYCGWKQILTVHECFMLCLSYCDAKKNKNITVLQTYYAPSKYISKGVDV